jgi:hypothetical protein
MQSIMEVFNMKEWSDCQCQLGHPSKNACIELSSQCVVPGEWANGTDRSQFFPTKCFLTCILRERILVLLTSSQRTCSGKESSENIRGAHFPKRGKKNRWPIDCQFFLGKMCNYLTVKGHCEMEKKMMNYDMCIVGGRTRGEC